MRVRRPQEPQRPAAAAAAAAHSPRVPRPAPTSRWVGASMVLLSWLASIVTAQSPKSMPAAMLALFTRLEALERDARVSSVWRRRRRRAAAGAGVVAAGERSGPPTHLSSKKSRDTKSLCGSQGRKVRLLSLGSQLPRNAHAAGRCSPAVAARQASHEGRCRERAAQRSLSYPGVPYKIQLLVREFPTVDSLRAL